MEKQILKAPSESIEGSENIENKLGTNSELIKRIKVLELSRQMHRERLDNLYKIVKEMRDILVVLNEK